MRLLIGQPAPDFRTEDVFDRTIDLRDLKGHKLMLSFYRFSACPFCNLRVNKLMNQSATYEEKGLKMISFWQSPKESILEHVGKKNPPFPMIPDPSKDIYKLYRVEKSWKGSMKLMIHDPSMAIEAMKGGFNPKHIDGEKNIIPADFLINPDLTIHKAFYGKHIGDHIPFSEIERFLEK